MNKNFVSKEISKIFANEETFDAMASIIGCMNYAIIMCKTDGQFAIWNRTATEILGKKESDVGMEKWAEYYSCHNLDGTPMSYQDLPLVKATMGIVVKQQEIIIKHEDEEKYIMCDADPIMHNGEIIGGVIVFRETTKERKLEMQMKNMLKDLEDLRDHQNKILERMK
jgi:hydrogenase-4 transcriptional activator